MKICSIMAAGLLAIPFLAAPSRAATATATAPTSPGKSATHPERGEGEAIRDRLENQHKRIEAGIKQGQLTAADVTQLQQLESHIRELLASFKANGKFTKAELQQVHAALKEASQQIYTDRHQQEGNSAPQKAGTAANPTK